VRYTDEQLFDVPKELWNKWLDYEDTPRNFFEFCIWRLNFLVQHSTNRDDWMNTEENHLRNYRLKSIRFYERKLGL
jgi:hypothetical protein